MGRFDDNVNVLESLQNDAVIPHLTSQDAAPIESLRQQQAQGIDLMDELVAIGLAEPHLGKVPKVRDLDEDRAEEEDSNLDEEGELTQNNAIDHVMTLDSYGKLR